MLSGNRSPEERRAGVVLKLDDVHVHYGHVHVLRGVSLEIRDGAVVALLGANGAGKSTMLKAISGIVRPSRGTIWFDREEIGRLDPSEIVRRGIVHCPEGRQVFPGLTVRENLMLGSYARGKPRVQFDRVLDIFPADAATGYFFDPTKFEIVDDAPAWVSSPGRCRVVSSRCSRSAERSWVSRNCCSSMSRASALRRSSSSTSFRS